MAKSADSGHRIPHFSLLRAVAEAYRPVSSPEPSLLQHSDRGGMMITTTRFALTTTDPDHLARRAACTRWVTFLLSPVQLGDSLHSIGVKLRVKADNTRWSALITRRHPVRNPYLPLEMFTLVDDTVINVMLICIIRRIRVYHYFDSDDDGMKKSENNMYRLACPGKRAKRRFTGSVRAGARFNRVNRISPREQTETHTHTHNVIYACVRIRIRSIRSHIRTCTHTHGEPLINKVC